MTDKKVSRAQFNETYLEEPVSVKGTSRRLRIEGSLNAQLASLRRWKWPPLRT